MRGRLATNHFVHNFGCQGGGVAYSAYSFMQARSSAAPIRITRHVGHSVLSTSVKRTIVDSYSHRLFVTLRLTIEVIISLLIIS